MQVLFFIFLKNILQDLAGFPMDKTSLLLPFKGDFSKENRIPSPKTKRYPAL